jgi:hypothetical protein
VEPICPADYEDCTESAAKTAKSKAALDILVSSCERKFTGRRKSGGGYTYFDPRQFKEFNIAGPNPTAVDLKRFDEEYSRYLAERRQVEIRRLQMEEEDESLRRNAETALRERQAEMAKQRAESENKKQLYLVEMQKRSQAAASKVQITSSNIECLYPALGHCDHFNLTIGLQNTSAETISSLGVGWTFVTLDQPTCPNAIARKRTEVIPLRSGDTAVLNVKGNDGPDSRKLFRICTKITDVEITAR